MPQLFVPVIVAALLGGGQAAPEISDPHLTYGHLGAPRPKGEGIMPGDIAYLSFAIKNLKTDDAGKIKYSIAIVITDDKGKVIFEQKPVKAFAQHFFGGGSVPAAAQIAVPLETKPGPVHWKITVKDGTTDKSTELKGTGKVLPLDFGLVHVGTYADVEEHVPVPPIGVVGSNIYLGFGVLGYGRGKDKQPDINVTLRILDDKGKPTFAKALTGRVHQELAPDVHVVPLQFALTLDRVGRYTLELSAKCEVCGKTSTVSIPVRILSAE
jgi:hypothetical protein